MADDVKIRIKADADLTAADEAQRKLRKLKDEEKESQRTTSPQPPAPAPVETPKPAPAPQPAPAPPPAAPATPAGRKPSYQLATEANPKSEPERPTQQFRKLTDEERQANRERIAAEDAAAESAKAKRANISEERAAARERRTAEQSVTREMREQQAMRKAGISRIAGAVSLGQDIAAGGNATGSLMSLAMGSGNLAVMIASTVAALTVGIKGMLDRQSDEATMRGLKFDERRASDAYRRRRASGIFGSSGELVSGALSDDEEIAHREKARTALEKKANVKWYAPSTWTWGGLRKTEGQVELEENENELIAARVRRASAIKQAQKKFMAEEGGLELRVLRGRSQRSLAGSREAFAAEMGQEWLAKYKEIMSASGSADIAKEMADLTVQNKVRDRQAQAGAGLVDARSGGAGIAAAAQWSLFTANMDAVANETKALNATVQSQANPIKDQAK